MLSIIPRLNRVEWKHLCLTVKVEMRKMIKAESEMKKVNEGERVSDGAERMSHF